MEKNRIVITDDDQLVNFREICMGKIVPGILYRCSNPLKGGELKKIKKSLAVKAGINCVINLEDSISVLENLSEDVPWYHNLVIAKKVIALPMTFTIIGVEFNEKKLKAALQFIITHEGPYLIHCFAGVDRTGIVSILLEALMEATLHDITEDYLKSFNSLYDSSIYSRANSKNTQVVTQLLSAMSNYMPINDQNLPNIAKRYLLNKIGLSLEEITLLKRKLAGEK